MLKAEYCYDFCRYCAVPDVGKSGFEFQLGQEITHFSYKTKPIQTSV